MKVFEAQNIQYNHTGNYFHIAYDLRFNSTYFFRGRFG